MPRLRSLTPGDRAKVEALYLAAPASDRQTRFFSSVSDSYVRSYVSKAFTSAEVLGAFQNDDLLGVAEVHIQDDEAELAFMVAPTAQHQGLGAQLMVAALSAAHERGAAKAMVTVCPRNVAMRRLALSSGLKRVVRDHEWCAEVELDPDSDLHFPSIYHFS